MLSLVKRLKLNQGLQSAGEAYKEQMGSEIGDNMSCVMGIYDFSKVGGAVGSFNLVNLDGKTVKIPANALVRDVVVYVPTACTSGGSATLALTIESAADTLAATAVASFSAAAKLQGIQDFATLADSVVTTAERNLVLSVAVAALTAGKVYVYVSYC